jgi:hypothetical protein
MESASGHSAPERRVRCVCAGDGRRESGWWGDVVNEFTDWRHGAMFHIITTIIIHVAKNIIKDSLFLSLMSAAASSSSSASAGGPQVMRSFLTSDDCAQLVALAASSSDASCLSLEWPSVGRVCVAVAPVDDLWQFANEQRLTVAQEKPFYFVRLTDAAPDDNDALVDNVLVVDSQGSHSFLNCNVGDAIVAHDSTVLCGVRSAHGAQSEMFAFAFPTDEPVYWPYFENLPLLVKQTILAMLDVDTFLAVGCVSHRWRDIVDGNSVWHERVLAQFGDQQQQKEEEQEAEEQEGQTRKQQPVLWRHVYARLATEQRAAAAKARFEPARRHFKPHWLLKEWVDTEKGFIDRFSKANVFGGQLVQRGFVWFDCFTTMFPLQERLLADITRMYNQFADAHISKSSIHCLRDQSAMALTILFCDWNARLASLALNPVWRKSAIAAVLAYRRTEGSIQMFDAVLAEVGGMPASPELSMIVFASRVARYRLLIREMRRPGVCMHPAMFALAALAEEALDMSFRDLTPFEKQCHQVAPKHRLEDFVAICNTASAQHTWIPLRWRAVHLLLVQRELLAIEKGTKDVVLSLQGATVTLDGAKLCVRTMADNHQHVFKGVSAEFIVQLQEQIRKLG